MLFKASLRNLKENCRTISLLWGDQPSPQSAVTQTQIGSSDCQDTPATSTLWEDRFVPVADCDKSTIPAVVPETAEDMASGKQIEGLSEKAWHCGPWSFSPMTKVSFLRMIALIIAVLIWRSCSYIVIIQGNSWPASQGVTSQIHNGYSRKLCYSFSFASDRPETTKPKSTSTDVSVTPTGPSHDSAHVAPTFKTFLHNGAPSIWTLKHPTLATQKVIIFCSEFCPVVAINGTDVATSDGYVGCLEDCFLLKAIRDPHAKAVTYFPDRVMPQQQCVCHRVEDQPTFAPSKRVVGARP